MKIRSGLYLGVAAIAIAACWPARRRGSMPSRRRGQHRQHRSRRRRHRPERAGSRRLGDRGDHRPADQDRQDRRHRRPGPLRAARSAEGQLQTSGCAATAWSIRRRCRAAPGKIAQPDRGAGAERRGGGRILSGGLLVLDDQDSGARASSPAPATSGNGINETMQEPGRSSCATFKTDGCFHCHSARQQGDAHDPGGSSASSTSGYEAWTRRIQSGQASTDMIETIERFGTERGLKMFADWTDRIAGRRDCRRPSRRGRRASSATSSSRCGTGRTPRPICTTRSRPTSAIPPVNANGPIYGATENSAPTIVPVLDPVNNTATTVQAPGARSEDAVATNDADARRRRPIGATSRSGTARPSPHNPMLDEKGRVWFTARIRPPANPGFCKKGSDHPSAKLFPISSLGPPAGDATIRKTKKFTLIDTCFTTHHLQFGFDKDNTLWTSAGGPAPRCVGWLNTKMFDETGDEEKSQGWTPFILDTNGNGKRDEGYVEPNQPVDPTKDKRIRVGFYGDRAEPGRRHRSGARCSAIPGSVVRRRSRRESAGDGAGGNLRGAGCRATRRAAWTSTATAWSGRRSRAATRRASTAASARARSTARPRPASIAPKAGRSIRCPARSSADVTDARQRRDELLHLGRPARHARARQGRADRHRQPERFADRAQGRQVGQLRVPYPMGFYAKGWTAASTIRTPAGRAAAVVERPATARRSTSKAARARRRRS